MIFLISLSINCLLIKVKMVKLVAVLALVAFGAIIESTFGAVNIIDIYKGVIFDYAVLKSRKPVVVFYYSSTSCTPCKWSIKPMLEKMAKRNNEKIYLATVDLDKVPELRKLHGITQIPTTRVFFKGQSYDSVEGLSWAKLVPLVNSAAKMT